MITHLKEHCFCLAVDCRIITAYIYIDRALLEIKQIPCEMNHAIKVVTMVAKADYERHICLCISM